MDPQYQAGEGLREASALGNIRSVEYHVASQIQQGVALGKEAKSVAVAFVNSQNKVNKWTSLHWAVSRHHPDVVEYLLSCGADPFIENDKQQTSVQLAIDKEFQDILEIFIKYGAYSPSSLTGQEEKQSDTRRQKHETTFIPNYLQYPEHAKVWCTLEETKPKFEFEREKKPIAAKESPIPVQEMRQLQVARTDSAPLGTPVNPIQPLPLENPQEILVFNKTVNAESILGAVFVDRQTSLKDMCRLIISDFGFKESCEFRLQRFNGEYYIPIHTRQMDQKVLHHFKDKHVAVLLF